MSRPYRPSNGSEGAFFMEKWCDRCEHDRAFREGAGDSCEIIARSMVFSVEEERYPKELVYGDDGWGSCTAYEAVDV